MSINYDGKTENGIPYLTKLYIKNFNYQSVVDDLDALYPTKKAALGGGSYRTYTLGDRSITRNAMDPDEIMALWDKLMAEKLQMEGAKTQRKAVGVVFRDW